MKARGPQADWPQHLPWVLLNIRTGPKTDSNISAAEMVYRAALTLPAQPPLPEETPSLVVDQQWAGRAIPTWELPQRPHTQVPAHLAAAEMVHMRKGGQAGPLVPPYSGTYKVIEKGPKYFNIDIGGQPQAVTVDRLKLHTGTSASTLGARLPALTSSSPARRTPSPGLPATTSAQPAREQQPPARLDL